MHGGRISLVIALAVATGTAGAAPKAQDPNYGPSTTPFAVQHVEGFNLTGPVEEVSVDLNLHVAFVDQEPAYCVGANKVITRINGVATFYGVDDTYPVTADLLYLPAGGTSSLSLSLGAPYVAPAPDVAIRHEWDVPLEIVTVASPSPRFRVWNRNAVPAGQQVNINYHATLTGYCVAP